MSPAFSASISRAAASERALPWDARTERAADAIIDTGGAVCAELQEFVLARTALSPLDLERRFGLIGGDIFRIWALTLDQLWAARPVLGHGAYRSPDPRLYMCGSGNVTRAVASRALPRHELGSRDPARLAQAAA